MMSAEGLAREHDHAGGPTPSYQVPQEGGELLLLPGAPTVAEK
jgi:hypothetical protein